jgi:hypothetical protein
MFPHSWSRSWKLRFLREVTRRRRRSRSRRPIVRRIALEWLEDRTVFTTTALLPAVGADLGSVSGRVWEDGNGNGVQDGGEAGLAGWIVYLDQNGNGSLDAGERSTLTDEVGNYQFTALAAARYTLTQLSPPDWRQTTAGSTRELFRADFSAGTDGFTSSGSANEWHRSTGRDTDTGHSAGGSFYFGAGEGLAGGGSYENRADGKLVSPLIDLRGAEGPVSLEFNHFVDVRDEGFDFTGVSVLAGGEETVLARQFWWVRLPIATDGFEAVRLDLSAFAGQQIQVQFAFLSDSSVT